MQATKPKRRQILVELKSPVIEKFLERCEREKRKPKNLAEFLIEQALSDSPNTANADGIIEDLRELLAQHSTPVAA